MSYKKEFKIAKRLAEQRLDTLLSTIKETPDTETTEADAVHTENASAGQSVPHEMPESHIREDVYERLVNGESFAQRVALEQSIDLHAANEKIKQKIAQKEKGSHSYRWIGWVASAAAAMVACILAIDALLDKPQSTGTPRLLTNSNEQVELILANGERYLLADHGQMNVPLPDGFDKVADTSDENRLVYNRANSGTEEKTASFITLKVPKKEECQIELPDGTVAYLNSCSSLRFPEYFSKTSRDVYLTGEVAFSVKKNEKAPFRVHTDERVIVVTGTQFNVSAYEGEPTWQATLVQGSIRIEGGAETVMMKPLQRYTLRYADGKETLHTVSAEEAVLAPWRTGMLCFENATLDDIEQKLQRWYDFSFVYETEDIKDHCFTASIYKNESSEDFFKLLEETANIRFEQDGALIRVRKRK